MLFVFFTVFTILAAAKKYGVQGRTRQWATGITAFILVIVSSYVAALAIGLSITAAASYTTNLDGLISAMHHPAAGGFISQLVALPTTILAVIFIPKWVFRLAAKTQPRAQAPEHRHTAPQPTDTLPFQHSSNAPRPAKSTRTAIIITITAILCLTVGAGASAAVFIITNHDETLPEVAAIPMTPTPRPEPTPTPIPTYTPAPTPTPTLEPTYAPRPTVKVYAPSPTPVNPGEPYIQAFASCNGKYQGEQRLGRENAARTTLQSGLRTLEGLATVIQERCPPPATSQIPALTPPAVAKLATTTPRPTITPQHTVARAPTFPTPSPGTSETVTNTVGSHHTTFLQFQNARWLSHNNPELATRMQNIPWVSDGLNHTESEVIKYLLYLAVEGQHIAVSDIIAMPFLTSVEPADLSALRSIRHMHHDSQNQYHEFINNPLFTQGITDEWTPIVATLSSPAQYQPELIQKLLNGNQVTLETKHIQLPLSGDVRLDIVRIGSAPARTIRLLEHAVTTAETFMGFPLPTNHIVVLFADVVTPGTAGHNSGSHIAIRPEYDVDDGSHEAESLPGHIAHEVAHYYWSANQPWIDEGLAELTASISEFARNGSTVTATNQPCPYLDTIEQLQVRSHSANDAAYTCNYTLGERLFIELYQAYGDMPFRQRLRQLYLSSIPDDGDSSPGTKVGITHVRTIFGNNIQGSKIIRRWYDGDEPFDSTSIDWSIPTSRIPSINGSVKSADLVLSTTSQPIQQFSASTHTGSAFIRFQYDHNVSGSPREQPLTLIEYYEDGHQTDHQVVNITVDNRLWTYHIGVGPPDQWKTGQYWAMIYDGSEKIAQVHWTVQP